MIRALEMQSVVAQSTAVEKVGQAQLQNQETNSRHLALLSEEMRLQQKSLVNDANGSGTVKNEIDKDANHSQKKKQDRRNSEEKESQADSRPSTGGLIDITV